MTWRNRLMDCPLGFGTMAVGGQFSDITDADAVAAIEAAANQGIRLFDTAPQYGCGLAEQRLGLGLRGVPRDDLIIATKVGKRIAPLGSGGQRQRTIIFPGGHDCEMVFDYSYDGTLKIVEDSLERLGLERLDLVLIHDVTRHFHGDTGVHERFVEARDGAVRALNRLKDEGLVGGIGSGLKDTDIVARFVTECAIDVALVPGRMSLLEQSGMTSGVFDLCLAHGVAVIAAAPFDSGILAGGSKGGGTFGYKAADGEIVARVAQIEAICARHGVELAAAALQYPLRHAAVTTVLCGMRSAHEVEQNVRWSRQPIPMALWDELLAEAGVPLPVGRHR